MGRQKKMKVHFSSRSMMHTLILSVLRDLRKEAGLSQHELSMKLGRNYDMVNKIECGTFTPSLDIMRDYGIFFGVTISEILKRAEDKSIHVQ